MKKLKSKTASEDKQRVVIYTEVRAKKKEMTIVEGLDTVGRKLKDSAKVRRAAARLPARNARRRERVRRGPARLPLPPTTPPSLGTRRAQDFAKRFACSSSVKDTPSGGKEIVIQGEVLFDLVEFLQGEYGIPKAKLYQKEKGGGVTRMP